MVGRENDRTFQGHSFGMPNAPPEISRIDQPEQPPENEVTQIHATPLEGRAFHVPRSSYSSDKEDHACPFRFSLALTSAMILPLVCSEVSFELLMTIAPSAISYRRVGNDLREPVMVAQIDEQHSAVIANALAPAG